jgi:hypothetical protein
MAGFWEKLGFVYIGRGISLYIGWSKHTTVYWMEQTHHYILDGANKPLYIGWEQTNHCILDGVSKPLYIGWSKQATVYWMEQANHCILDGANKPLYIGCRKQATVYWM